MHKLENPLNAPQAFAIVTFQSASEVPAIALLTEPVRRQEGTGNWVDDPTRRKQIVSYVGPDGAQALVGTVPESEAVEITGAFKVVAEVSLEAGLSATREAGRVSRAFTGVELARVVEVWSTPSKCLFRSGTAAANGKTVEVKPLSAADFTGVRK